MTEFAFQAKQLAQAVKILRGAGVVIFPTDTVWGIGALVSSQQGIKKLYQIKGRPESKPTAVLVKDVHMANRYGVMNKLAWQLAQKYWPGALTIIVKAKGNKVPKLARGGGKTVGLRAPNHQLAQELIKAAAEGIVAGSANFSGGKAAVKKTELDKRLLSLVDLILDGECGGQPPSTIVDTSHKLAKILRRGPIKPNLTLN